MVAQTIPFMLERRASEGATHPRATVNELPGHVHSGYYYTLVRWLNKRVHCKVIRFMEDGIQVLSVDKAQGSRYVEPIRKDKGVVEHKVVSDGPLWHLLLLAIPSKADDSYVGSRGGDVVRLKGSIAAVGDG